MTGADSSSRARTFLSLSPSLSRFAVPARFVNRSLDRALLAVRAISGEKSDKRSIAGRARLSRAAICPLERVADQWPPHLLYGSARARAHLALTG